MNDIQEYSTWKPEIEFIKPNRERKRTEEEKLPKKFRKGWK